MKDIEWFSRDRMGGMRPFMKERVSKAFQILDGIPDRLLALDSFTTWALEKERNKFGGDWRKALKAVVREFEEEHRCGTLACGAGFLQMHPYFQQLGLYPDSYGDPRYDGAHGHRYWSFEALDQVFLYPPHRGDDQMPSYGNYTTALFATRGSGVWDKYLMKPPHGSKGMTDKALVLARLKYAHQHHSA
jgi:hypothetical protein